MSFIVVKLYAKIRWFANEYEQFNYFDNQNQLEFI